MAAPTGAREETSVNGSKPAISGGRRDGLSSIAAAGPDASRCAPKSSTGRLDVSSVEARS